MADAKLIVKRLIEEPWKGNWDVIDEYAGESKMIRRVFYDSGFAEVWLDSFEK